MNDRWSYATNRLIHIQSLEFSNTWLLVYANLEMCFVDPQTQKLFHLASPNKSLPGSKNEFLNCCTILPLEDPSNYLYLCTLQASKNLTLLKKSSLDAHKSFHAHIITLYYAKRSLTNSSCNELNFTCFEACQRKFVIDLSSLATINFQEFSKLKYSMSLNSVFDHDSGSFDEHFANYFIHSEAEAVSITFDVNKWYSCLLPSRNMYFFHVLYFAIALLLPISHSAGI